jgi:hypothetical protein
MKAFHRLSIVLPTQLDYSQRYVNFFEEFLEGALPTRCAAPWIQTQVGTLQLVDHYHWVVSTFAKICEFDA